MKIPTVDITDETLAIDDTQGDDVRGGAPPDGLGPRVGFRVLFQSQIASQKYFSFSILVKFNVCTLIYILGGVKDPANDFRRKQK